MALVEQGPWRAVDAVALVPPRKQSELLPGEARALLERHRLSFQDLEGIAVGAGPGSFTGLRIGLATAKGLAFAATLPLWLASSLAALAWSIAEHVDDRTALLVPVLDARRGELYAGFYRRDDAARLISIAPERVMPPAALADAIASACDASAAVIAGDALTVHADALASLPSSIARATAVRATPSALGVAVVAAAGPRTDALAHGAPAYIR